jgi:hypothetical protein
MLAPLIFDMLIASLLIVLVGWASDALRACTHGGQSYLAFEGSTARNRASRPRRPLPHNDHDAARTARHLRRHQPPGRLPSYRLSIRRLLPQAPEPRVCH